ncbi:phosphoribosylglycinamide formyltransferase [Sphingomonas sp. DBB INV C78]|uniref:MmcQ/YjbR family DNA-binding protein n=1 Tax=Sphingomonas sp. DBB INV C78 TaxID=3349434 RepID=UPI0036D25699
MSDPRLLEEVRRICLALPEASTKLSHGSHAFQVAGKKMFAYFTDDHHHDGITSVCVKTSGRDEQEMLLESDPELYYFPAYIGVSGWIGIRLEERGRELAAPDWDHVADRVAHSYRLAAPKRLAAQI